MAGFGSLAPNDDWQEQEAQAALAAQQEASRPSGLSTMWSAIKHPSLYPLGSSLMAAEAQPKPAPSPDLPDVGAPLIPSGPQISSGTRLGSALTGALPEAVAGAIKSGATAPGRAAAGEIPMWGPGGHTSEEMVQAGSDLAALAGGASVAGTLERAAASPGRDLRILGRQVLASDTGKPGMAIAAAEHVPQYTTGIESALERIPSQELTGAQWLNQLKRYGAKPEELDWRKLGPALEGLGNAKISRAGIEEHLTNNPIQLTPTVREDAPAWENLTPQQQHFMAREADRRADALELRQRLEPRDYYEQLRADGEVPQEISGGQPRYREYAIPGGENYRERLIQMPVEEPKFGIFHGDNRIAPEMEFNRGNEARNWALTARHGDALTPAREDIPYDAVVRQTNDPEYFTQEHGSHWEEPNVLFHRRSTDQHFPQPLTEAEQAQNTQRASMLDQLSEIQRQQWQTGRDITTTAQPMEQARRRQIYEDMKAGRITGAEASRRLETYELPTEVKPLQDKLQQLRRQEDEIRRNMPEEVQPKTIRSLHDEEAQSDWHQQGRDKGYGLVPRWEVRDEQGRVRGPLHASEEAAQQQAQAWGHTVHPASPASDIPNAPFKGTGWERLAMHDQLREAAEKGYPRISWTAGEENPTNPLTMLRSHARPLSELSPERQAEVLKADRGLRDYYNRRRVDQANKIGKAHGAQVERSSLPSSGMSGHEAMDRLGIHPMHRADYWEQLNNNRGAPLIPSGELEGQRLTRDQLLEAARNKGIATYHMDIPDSLRRELLSKPMSLFEDTGEAGKAAAVARQIEQKGAAPTYENWHDALEGKAGGTGQGEAGAGDTGVGAAGADVPGGAGGRDARIRAAQTQAANAAGSYSPLPGLPTKPLQIGGEHFVPGPIAKVKDVAESYMRGRPKSGYHTEPERYHPIDEEHSRNIAKAYDEMEHEPNNPAVKASYQAMIDETRQQYRHIRQMHPELQLVPNEAGVDPYAISPRLAAKDVIENNRLHFFPTDQGYGTSEQGGIEMATHPMLQPSGETLNGRPLLNNDLFRIVHDYFGHLKEGYGFRATGEDNAWRSHAAMYSDLARPAMTSETRGQNSWVNYGPHAEANKGASAADTVYADQKVGLMPEWTMRDRNSPAPIITYQASPSAHRQIDMSKIGTGEGSGVRGAGMYSAGHEPIAEWYRHQLAARFDPLLKKYKLSEDQGSRLGIDLANSAGDHEPVIADLQDYITDLERTRQRQGDGTGSIASRIKASENMIRYLNDPDRFKGHMYQLAIDRPPEHFLDWDKPLSQQSDYVREKLQPMIEGSDKRMKAARAHLLARAQERLAKSPSGVVNQKLQADIQRYSKPIDWENMPGKNLYEMAAHEALGTPPLNMEQGYPISSQYLRNKGIAGVQYESGTIHKAHQGHTNYATFDPPRILKRYAIPGAVGAGATGFGALAPRGDDGS